MTDYLDDWEPCQTGQLSHMAEQLKTRHRQQVVRQFLTGGGTVVVAAALLCVAVIGWRAQTPDKISCSQVVGMLEAFHRNALDATWVQQITTHLRHCPSCSHEYELLQEGDEETSRAAAVESLASQPPLPFRGSKSVWLNADDHDGVDRGHDDVGRGGYANLPSPQQVAHVRRR